MKPVATSLLTALVTGLALAPSTAHAQPVGGRIDVHDIVAAQSTDTWTVTLRGGETTRIRLYGDGDTCLELRVYDENGYLVASDTWGPDDYRVVYLTPRWTGRFKVKVTNIGRVFNEYFLVLD